MRIGKGLVIAALACAAATAGYAQQEQPVKDPATKDQPAKKADSCFFANQFESWRSPDPKTIFIRVTGKRYYRLDLAASCSALQWPSSHLITKYRGSSTVCSAVDWDLKVSQGQNGITQACIVKTMTPLTPDQVKAIPKKFKP